MMTVKCKGYVAQIDYDNAHGCYHGQVINIQDLIRFQGTSPSKATQAFKDCVDVYLATCQRRGMNPQLPVTH